MKAVLSVVLVLVTLNPARARDFSDPKPPEVFEVAEGAQRPEAEEYEGLTYIAAPRSLSPEAVTEDWPRFLGPNDNAISGETHLLGEIPASGPPKVWERTKGEGYTSPVVVGDSLVVFHRIEDGEVIECLDPASGKRYWQHEYPVQYEDRYGFSNGPRASAVIDSGKVYTLGVTSVLTCLDLKTGSLLWQRDLNAEFEVAPYFFGHGAAPLVHDGKVIISLGGEGELAVAAFDQHLGKLVWGTEHEWHASYASPVIANLQGEDRLLSLMGGDTDPPSGGLLAINPKTGALLDAFPWRAQKYESVNASTPVSVGGDQVYISDCYVLGGVLLKLGEDLKWKEAWRAPDFGMHWMTPVAKDGHLYGFRGRNEPDAWLACYRVADGNEQWQEDFAWELEPGFNMKFLRGSLLHADGRFYSLGELGSLAILDLTPEKAEMKSHAQLFAARATWSLPVLSKGLLYVAQHEKDQMNGDPPRWICYDLRAE